MAGDVKRTLRLSQTVSPFGVGAILDVNGESLMGVDISSWEYDRTTRVVSRRLEEGLGVKELRSPPSVPAFPSGKTPGIYYQRFPGWLFCQDCRRMHHALSHEEDGQAPVCRHCQAGLVPMRFVAVCTRGGHAMDVPWGRWAHSEHSSADEERCRNHVLALNTSTGGTESLRSLVVECLTCGAARHLGDLQTEGAMARIGFACTGRQPWQNGNKTCVEKVEVLQRGATQVTLSETTTALDIPEPSVPIRDMAAEIRQHRVFEDFRTAPGSPAAPVFIDLIVRELKVSEELVRSVATGNPGSAEHLQDVRSALLKDEWHAFVQAIDSQGEVIGDRDFKVSSVPLLPDLRGSTLAALGTVVQHVVLAHKLREVRVLHGFRRYSLEAQVVDVDLGARGRERWLPAVESFGEGVFLALNGERLRLWEQDERVLDRCRRLERRRQTSLLASRFPAVTPRLVLLHTLAHLLMRRLAFSCGYSSASLRERVYGADGPADERGLLLYTAAGDAEGTLGGLVRQGEPPRLARTLLAALEDAAWCSSDPICLESHGQGLAALNLAACHGCALAAETSCERSNVLLDRVLVVGNDSTPGYFAEVLQSIREAASAGSL